MLMPGCRYTVPTWLNQSMMPLGWLLSTHAAWSFAPAPLQPWGGQVVRPPVEVVARPEVDLEAARGVGGRLIGGHRAGRRDRPRARVGVEGVLRALAGVDPDVERVDEPRPRLVPAGADVFVAV